VELTDVLDALAHVHGFLGHEDCLLLLVVFEGTHSFCDLFGFLVVEGLRL
jgi:hypothetical protein